MMLFRNMKIGSQLTLGLGVIFLFVIVLCGVVSQQHAELWQNTEALYNHSLQVKRTLSTVESNVLRIDRGLKDLLLTSDAKEREQALEDMAIAKANIEQQFSHLYEQYLGPRAQIDELRADFAHWDSITEETIRLLREGKLQEAITRTKKTGIGGQQVKKVISSLQRDEAFARTRSEQFYQRAEQKYNQLAVQLTALIGVILVVTFWINWLLARRIRNPIQELTEVTKKYREGSYTTRSTIVSKNEMGLLATSFNSLVDTIQDEFQRRKDSAVISSVMLGEEEPHAFCRELLTVLVRKTESQMGAVYLRNEAKPEFILFESLGLSSTPRMAFSATLREGEFGMALATQQISRISDIDGETAFTLVTASGDIRPREIMTIPILFRNEVVAVLSLAKVSSYSEQATQLIDDIWSTLMARFVGVLSFRKVQAFSETLEQQNRELHEKSCELVRQTEELREQNIELDIQKQQLAEASRMKTVFLSTMSHELRTPLNSIIALSGVLVRRLKGLIPEEEHGYLAVIQRNGRHLLALINDILDVARIESGREELSLRAFPVSELIDGVIERLSPQAREKGIALTATMQPDLPLLTSDFPKCQHILENLVANAIKFTDKGSVAIFVSALEDKISFAVKDTGCGIPAEKINIIFDAFRQADESIARKYGGTGLGLTIAKKYAQLLSGDITVESQVGQGTIVTLSVPLMLSLSAQSTDVVTWEEVPKSKPCSSRRVLLPAKGETRILLVEDDAGAIIQMRDLLEPEGYAVRIARNGKEALEAIEKEIPDAMILDLMMPEVDGFTLLSMIRSKEATSSLPVLILTAKHITSEEIAFLKGKAIHQLVQKGDVCRDGLLSAVQNMVVLQAPSENEKELSVPRQPRPIRSRPVRSRPVVLIVEDKPDNLLTAKALIQEHYEPLGASDGEEGLALAKKEVPDLILLDISLPGMDGFQVFDALRQDKATEAIPVVALTAKAMKGDREEILLHGFDGYLSKPVDAELLEETIRRFFHGE